MKNTDIKQDKKVIETTVFSKVSYNKPIPFGDINIELQPDDIIISGHEEAEYRSDGGHDPHWYLTVYRDRIETDEEYNKRIERDEANSRAAKQRRYETYLRYKKEFEND